MYHYFLSCTRMSASSSAKSVNVGRTQTHDIINHSFKGRKHDEPPLRLHKVLPACQRWQQNVVGQPLCECRDSHHRYSHDEGADQVCCLHLLLHTVEVVCYIQGDDVQVGPLEPIGQLLGALGLRVRSEGDGCVVGSPARLQCLPIAAKVALQSHRLT
jgi:hypothetical protein